MERIEAINRGLARTNSRDCSSLWQDVLWDVHSLWLFTLSDLKTIVVPQSVFGVLNAAYADAFGLPAQPWLMVGARVPLTFLWVWVNLLPFNINNQRQPEAIAEDSLNKPWRPLPLRRMTPDHARSFMFAFYLAALVMSSLVGSIRQCVSLILLGTWYNCFGGADAGPVLRNLINAAGFLCFSTGAMEVAYGGRALPRLLPATTTNTTASMAGDSGGESDAGLLAWIAIVGAIVFSTVQSQDLADQKGDLLRKRRTLPLVIGDAACRATLCLLVPMWTVFVSAYWQCRPILILIISVESVAISVRTWTKRSVDDDKTTFRLWNLWLMTLYTTPVIA